MKSQANNPQARDQKSMAALGAEIEEPLPVSEKNEKPKLKIVKPAPHDLQKLIEIGIPIKKAVFHRAVLFDHKTSAPETAYYSPTYGKDLKKHKVARMWYTPHGLICEQNDQWKIIPLANVSDTVV